MLKKVLALWSALCRRLAARWSGGIYYIGGSESLPPPLPPEEERALLQGYDGTQLAVRQVLIERNLRLVVYIARKFENTGIGLEDLISIGTIGLIKAVNTYRPDKNAKLATYASRCIENEILMVLRKSVNQRSEVSDVLGTEPDCVMRPVEDDVEKQILLRLLCQLPQRERVIIVMRFGLGGGEEMTQKEVADRLGISQSYISRLEKRIIQRLKKELLRAL